MAQWTSAVEVTFNDNDGKIGYRLNPEGVRDFNRYQVVFGKYRARWIMLKWFWKGLMHAERMNRPRDPFRKWVFRASIPE